ncbi:hypothetical protein [Saliphagus sp. LR7]|uniref:hypothetical protein n=1 Tax=Saliphagus sp. LR7 TaxID=2282654 RepID=UPI00130074E8|nr:hypothetical protein [Saliphagus sp. LR7]
MDAVERELTGAIGDSIGRARAFAGYVESAGDVDPEAAGLEPIDTSGIASSLRGYLVGINAAIDLLDVRDGRESAPTGLGAHGPLRRFARRNRTAIVEFRADPAEAANPEEDLLILGFEIDAERRRFYADVPALPAAVEDAYAGERYVPYTRPDGRPKVPVSGLCLEITDRVERWASRRREG